MKRILIISELFYPQNAIGALRPTKLRDALIKKGYAVDVITRSRGEQDQNSENGSVWRIDETEGSLKKKNVTFQTTNRLICELKRAKRTNTALKNGKNYSNRVIRFIETNNIDIDSYDSIITTFGPISSVIIGLAIKKKFHKINWICDFRDPMVVNEVSIFFKPFMKYYQNKACQKADAVVAVSNGYLKRICGKKYANKAHMIPNGYDVTDLTFAESCAPSNDVIHIVYVGSLYEGKRKVTPLFRVLRELADEGKIDINKVCFDYAGGDGLFLYGQAKEFGLNDIVCDHGVLSREECLKLQFSSHFLVLSTWNNRGEEGVFPGKFLEYMLVGKPIISITDGNLPNGEVSSVMREGRLGIAYEAVNSKEDILELKKYIQNSYIEWSQNGCITFEPNKEVLDRYRYDHIVDQFEELFCEK